MGVKRPIIKFRIERYRGEYLIEYKLPSRAFVLDSYSVKETSLRYKEAIEKVYADFESEFLDLLKKYIKRLETEVPDLCGSTSIILELAEALLDGGWGDVALLLDEDKEIEK